MASVQKCLSQIESVREAATDPEMAYLLRTRLRRVLLSCARTAAEMAGSSLPELPGHVELPPGSLPDLSRIADLSSSILSASTHLCQPSEALDVRWEKGWGELSEMLDGLEAALSELRKREQTDSPPNEAASV